MSEQRRLIFIKDEHMGYWRVHDGDKTIGTLVLHHLGHWVFKPITGLEVDQSNISKVAAKLRELDAEEQRCAPYERCMDKIEPDWVNRAAYDRILFLQIWNAAVNYTEKKWRINEHKS